jgi:cytochrome c oxidase assembly factor CtaG
MSLATKAKNIANEANELMMQYKEKVKQYYQDEIFKAAERGQYNYKMTSMVYWVDGKGTEKYNGMEVIVAWLRNEGFKVENTGYDIWRVYWE